MSSDRPHLSDRELLMAVDRELPWRRSARVDRHLGECASCQARSRQIAATLVAANEASMAASGALPPAAQARARLRRGIAELSRQATSSSPLRVARDVSGVRRWAVAAAAVLVFGSLGALLAVRPSPLASDTSGGEPGVFLLPRPDLTPGSARPVSRSDVCGNEPYARVRPVPVSVHRAVFDRYGADFGRTSDYELDHLVTPELGGTADARNLWPQPFAGTAWNAFVKDELELHLHQLVCAGTIEVAAAQREIATDWIAAYKRRFRTEQPLRDYAASPLTERDSAMLRAELAELGIRAPAHRAFDGPLLLALLQTARHESSRRDRPR